MFKLEIVMYNKDSKMKALRTVLRLGSFTKAAHALGYTQSSISQMMASLEEELSFKLLIRSRNGITLTQEGQQLYPFLEQVLHSYEAMEEKAREIRGPSQVSPAAGCRLSSKDSKPATPM